MAAVSIMNNKRYREASPVETETIPCDLCNEQITFTEWDHHVASHSAKRPRTTITPSTINNTNKNNNNSSNHNVLSASSTPSPYLASVVSSEPCQATRSTVTSSSAAAATAVVGETKSSSRSAAAPITRAESMIPCDVAGCGQSIPASLYASHSATHTASSAARAATASNSSSREDESETLRKLQNREGLTMGVYQQQYVQELEKRYRKGQITLSELNDSKSAVATITEGADPHRVVGLLPAIRAAYANRRDIVLRLCDTFEFYYRSAGDGGWGCGLKNTQTLCSSLLRHACYQHTLFDGAGVVPSIPVLQAQIDYAHAQGYDPDGSAQLGKLVGSDKWIGAMDVAALLRSFGVTARVVNFILNDQYKDHSSLLKWVWEFYAPNANIVRNSTSTPSAATSASTTSKNALTAAAGTRNSSASAPTISSYFTTTSRSTPTDTKHVSTPTVSSSPPTISGNRICPPIYFQHEGHSRTIIGAALNTRTSKIELIVLDPDVSGGAVNLLSDLRDDKKWRRISRSLRDLKAKAYQLTVVEHAKVANARDRHSLKLVVPESGMRVR